MGRPKRTTAGGLVYHVLNRANARIQVFDKPEDYDAFERILEEAVERHEMRLLSYCVMPNHWHLVLWPRNDGDLSRFVGWLTLTHTQRWHAHRQTVGTGHVYQGRFKSFVVQSDEHFWTVCRYVERNALRANLIDCAEDWRWNSLWRRTFGSREQRSMLSDGPVERPRAWRRRVNQSLTVGELNALRRCVNRGKPFGSDVWTNRVVKRLGLESTLRPRGRPKKIKGS